MNKFVALAAGAAMIGGTMAATSADARPGYRGYGGYGGGYHRRGYGGGAVAAGLAGALIGGAIASQQRPYYGGGYGYAPAYGGYGYAPAYGYGYYQRPYRVYRPRPVYYYGY